MNARHLALLEQRLQLQARIAGERAELARVCAPLESMTQAAGSGMALGNNLLAYLKEHPLPVVALAAALLVFKPRPSLRWARRAVFLWRGWKLLRHRLADLQQSFMTGDQRSR